MWASLAFSTALASLVPGLVAASAADAIVRASIVGRDVELLSSYDYVIAGAGPAGLTVADRLTENPQGNYPSRTYYKVYSFF